MNLLEGKLLAEGQRRQILTWLGFRVLLKFR